MLTCAGVCCLSQAPQRLAQRAHVSICHPYGRQAAYVSTRQHVSICQHTSAYVSIRQHTSAYAYAACRAAPTDPLCQHTSAHAYAACRISAYVSIRVCSLSYASIRQHTRMLLVALHKPFRSATSARLLFYILCNMCVYIRMLTYADVCCQHTSA
jgi:hypothetical protein